MRKYTHKVIHASFSSLSNEKKNLNEQNKKKRKKKTNEGHSSRQNGCLYVYGGLSSIGSRERSQSLFRARLDAPPLLEAAWESFASHCPTISTPMPASVTPAITTPTTLDFLAAGVPRRLIQRLAKLNMEQMKRRGNAFST